LVKFSTY